MTRLTSFVSAAALVLGAGAAMGFEDIADQYPQSEGRQMTMLLVPKKR